MSRTITIAQRELSSMFRVPAGWIIIALFAFLTAVLFVNQTVIPGQPGSLRYFFAYSGWLLIPIAPAISMRLMSEEYRSGSIEALRTAPAGEWAVSLGKYLGSVGFLLLMLLPTLVYPLVLVLISEPAPDWGPIAAGYLMLVLVGMLYLSIGMLASSLTASQTLAFLGTVMSLILLMVLTGVISDKVSVRAAALLHSVSIVARINELSKGIIDTSTVAFFLIGSIWMLVLSAGVLEIRRLGRSRKLIACTGALFLLATGAAAGFSGYITSSMHWRTDVTSLGVHELSPRAARIVDRLSDPTEIVLAVSMSHHDARSIDLVSDVLDAYERASASISVRLIDMDTPEGIEQTKSLLADLVQRDQASIRSNLESLDQAAQSMVESRARLNTIINGLESIAQAIEPSTQTDANNQAVFKQRASIFRVQARDVPLQGESIRAQLEPFIEQTAPSDEVFPFDRLADSMQQSLNQLMTQLDDLGTQVDAFANAAELDPGPRAVAAPLVARIESARNQIASALDRAGRLEQVDALRVGRALETGETLLVIGSPEQGVSAVDIDELLPSSLALERTGVSAAGVIGPRAQELIASAIARLVAPAQPILVIMHGGQPGALMSNNGFMNKTIAHLQGQGIDTLEWAATQSSTPPDLDLLNPLGNRPVVYMVFPVDSTAQSNQSGLSGARNAEAMGKIVEELLDRGERLIISLVPSIYPASSQRDPLARAVLPFGIDPDCGHPILHERVGPMGRFADPITTLVPSGEQHPIAHALSGLSSVLVWAIPIEIRQTPGVSAWPILSIEGDDATWGERDWISLWGRTPQARQVMTNQPRFDQRDDIRRDEWILAAAAERSHLGQPQRLIVVGSHGWASDAITAENEQLVDGRITTRWAGNSALLDASIAWLSGMDDLIGAGTQARPIAIIKPLGAQQFSVIRWVLLAGLPGLILILGMAYRLIFG